MLVYSWETFQVKISKVFEIIHICIVLKRLHGVDRKVQPSRQRWAVSAHFSAERLHRGLGPRNNVFRRRHFQVFGRRLFGALEMQGRAADHEGLRASGFGLRCGDSEELRLLQNGHRDVSER